ncbi:MFS transporter [Actinomadura sp. HBU206391]|uniref:MFS transporter n=1 Tax=Actinomadura sp. HBU206391 TaxID=2731692 RepID=UPI00164F7FFB|nr:MFS transporter [Actinomadura sp. HBU206391]MBC6459201.1 MFS transporter [Actinomadura sp. HBU206391]
MILARSLVRARPATTPAEDRHDHGSPGLRRVNLALFAAGLTTFMSLYSTQALLPVLSQAFAVSPTAASLLVSLSTGTLALAVVPVSALSERYGRTRVMTWCALAAALLGLLMPVAPTFAALAVLRATQGVALAGVPAVAMAYLADEVHRDALGGAMGLYIAGNTVGGLLGRLVPGLVTDVAGWRWGLGVTALVALAFTLAFWALLPRSRFFRPARVDHHAVAAHLRDPGLRRLYTTGLLLMAGFGSVYNFLGYRLLAAPFHLPQAVVGLMFLMYLGGTWSSTAAGRLADRAGRRAVLACALVTMTAGLLLTLPASVPAVGAGLLVFTAGFFAAHSVASGWAGLRASTARAQAAGLYLFAYYLGGSAGGSAGGLAFEHGGWPGVVAYVLILTALAALAATTIGTRARRGGIAVRGEHSGHSEEQ